MSDQTIRAARAYCARGLAVFPLNGKIPITTNGVHDASTDLATMVARANSEHEESIESWLAYEHVNIGIAIPPGYVVVDIDPRNGGLETFAEWCADPDVKAAFDTAPMARTGGGGYHYWFKYDGRPLVKAIGGVDFQREGKYVVAPPSSTGITYAWKRTLPGRLDHLPELPHALLTIATRTEPERTRVERDWDDTDPLNAAVHASITWEELLAEHGWTQVGDNKWRHPSSENQFSATITNDCLFVYTPNTQFEMTESGAPHGYTLFSAYALLEHGGDFRRAADALRAMGSLPAIERDDPANFMDFVGPRVDGIEPLHDLVTTALTSIVPGGSFIFDEPAEIEIRWGRANEVLWANGESLMLVGPPGVGKTTLAHQLVRSLIGLDHEVLGFPVQPAKRVLYLAMDRPRQIRRAFRRLFTAEEYAVLQERLLVQRGPLPIDIARDPSILQRLAEEHECDVIVIDSLKDAAVKLSDDEVGGNVNRAIQLCNANSIDVCILHHQRKGVGGEKPNTLEDVYGSSWLTAGTGSVVLVWGQAGADQVELIHLKQPADPVGPLNVEHDHVAGVSRVVSGFNVLAYLKNRGAAGASLSEVLQAEHGQPVKASDAKGAACRRRLARLVSDGTVIKTEAAGGAAGSTNYRLAELRAGALGDGLGDTPSDSESAVSPSVTTNDTNADLEFFGE